MGVGNISCTGTEMLRKDIAWSDTAGAHEARGFASGQFKISHG